MTTNDSYHVGGNVPKDHPSYVYRQADEEFYKALITRQFCYVLNARQMGKSSLLVRTRERLRQAGIACATVDITQIGSESTLIEWYAGIIRTILDDFHWDDFDLTEWWESCDFAPLSPLNHLSQFIEKVLLVRTEPQSVVIFIDETDAMRRFGEDFFAMIRSCYNLRADKPAYQRLTFAILGVVSPSDLIQDKGKTPFNIGQGIELTGFQLQEAEPLLSGLQASNYPAVALLPLILQWTGGQPFLTQKVCRLVKEAKPPLEKVEMNNLSPADKEETNNPSPLLSNEGLNNLSPLLSNEGLNNLSPLLTKEGLGVVESWLTQLMQEKIIKNWEAQDEPAHLRNIRDRLLQKDEKNRARLLGLYQRILQMGEVPTDGSSEQMELRLSGAVVQREGVLRPYNPIYAQVFGEQWVSTQLAILRPYSEALQGWLGSVKHEESFLLRGQALQEAETWAQEKSLMDDDYRFLQASQSLAQREAQKRLQAKAQKRLISVLGVSLGVAVGLTVWAWLAQERAVESERIAEQQRNVALAQKQLALQAINNLTYEKMEKLLDVAPAKTVVLSMFKENIKTLEAIYALDPETQEAEREKASNYEKIGNVQLQLGNTAAAVQAYEQTHEILKRLSESDPDSSQAQQDLAFSYERIGDVKLRLGESQSALEAYQKEFEILDKLAKSDPDSSAAKRALSVSYEMIGDVKLRLGESQSALEAYQKEFEILDKLAKSDPDSSAAKRDLSVSYNKLGDVQLQLGNTAAAVQAYEQAMSIRKRLAESDPDSSQAQRDLSVSYEKLGNVQLQLGNTAAAVQAYEQALSISKRLAESDPDSSQAQRDLYISYAKLGQLQEALNNVKDSLQAFQQALSIAEKLAAQDPLNVQIQKDLRNLVVLKSG